MKTYKSRKPRKSSTSCRNSTEASNHSVTVTEPGVAYTALNAQHASPPKRAGGSFKRPTITAIEDRKSDDTDEDVRISEARTDGRTSTELLESSFHPQSSSNPDEDTAHTLLDTEVSGGGSDIVNGDANILVAPATIKPVSDLMVTSDPELEKCLDANRSPKHDQQAFEKRGLDSSPESVSQVVQEEGPVGGGAKAAVGAAQPAREVDPGVREGEILDDEFPAPSRGPPQGCDGTSEFSGSTQADEWTVTEHRAEEREIEAPAAKRRKCGNVKRVRVCADTSDDNPPLLEDVERQVPKPVKSESLRVVGTGAVESTPGDIRRSDQQGGGLSSRPTPSTQGADSSVPVSAGTTADKPPHVKRIIKAISYNQTVINGKQEVVVIFRALRYSLLCRSNGMEVQSFVALSNEHFFNPLPRISSVCSSDGQEVFVNNTDLRNKYPLLVSLLPTSLLRSFLSSLSLLEHHRHVLAFVCSCSCISCQLWGCQPSKCKQSKCDVTNCFNGFSTLWVSHLLAWMLC